MSRARLDVEALRLRAIGGFGWTVVELGVRRANFRHHPSSVLHNRASTSPISPLAASLSTTEFTVRTLVFGLLGIR